MNVVKRNEDRGAIWRGQAYTKGTMFLLPIAFGLSLTVFFVSRNTLPSMWELFFITIVPIIFRVLSVLAASLSGGHRWVADSNLDSKKFEYPPSAERPTTYYYPAIGVNYTSITSVGMMLNQSVGVGGFFHFLFWVAVIGSNHGFITSITTGFLALLVSLVICWAFGAALSIKNLVFINKAKRSELAGKQRYVEMRYSASYADKLVEEQSFSYYVDRTVRRSESEDLMGRLIADAYNTAWSINGLIADGYVDSELLTQEIETVEYVINDFAIKSIITTNNYFKKHRGNDVAKGVYINEIENKVEAAALEALSKLKLVRKTVKTLTDRRLEDEKRAKEKVLESKRREICVDDELAALGYDKPLPIPYFQDFHTLDFDNEQNKVAAANIVKNSLPTLIEARDRAKSKDDEAKLDKQISKVQSFVKSIAKDTDESKARKAKLLALEKQNLLYLSEGKDTLSDIDNTIAINNRYLDSYDKTLPVSKD